jgi:hypothetical protein
MKKAVRFRVLGAFAIAAALALPTGSAMAAGSHPHAYTCSGGDFATLDFVAIPSGTYASITVTGVCQVPAYAVINVVGNVNVRAGGVLDAQTFPSTITVGHNVTAAKGSLLGLGCQPPSYTGNSAHTCGGQTDPGAPVDPNAPENPYAEDHSTITVHGNVMAANANTVLLNGVTVKGNVTLAGGGGDIPWSIKNNMIGGNLTVSKVTADWLGVLFNHIGKNAILTNITATDPGDPGRLVYVVRNTVARNLICKGLAPGVSGGFFPGEVNTVGRHALGQCASLV